jgi:DNA-directed RNA polymerase specialized sigma24 family protein
MSSDGSVTNWLDPLRAGDPEAARALWQRYFQGLVALARQRLGAAPRAAADEEDVALSAFDSFCRGAQRGRFEQLLDRDGLWRLLVVLTARKASHLVRDQARHKRGGAAGRRPMLTEDGSEWVPGREPSPEFAAEVAEQCRLLLARLADPELERIALARMEGYSVEEIADQLACAPRTIKRKLQLIRNVWEEEGDR